MNVDLVPVLRFEITGLAGRVESLKLAIVSLNSRLGGEEEVDMSHRRGIVTIDATHGAIFDVHAILQRYGIDLTEDEEDE